MKSNNCILCPNKEKSNVTSDAFIVTVVYSSNDFSCLKDGPGKLIRTVTEPAASAAEGRGLNEAFEGEESTFTVTTNDIKGQVVYSEIDQVNVEIISIST